MLKYREKKFPLQRGKIYMVGRENADIVLQDDLVDSKHAIVEIVGRAAVIIDIYSRAGTFVHGRKLEPMVKTTIDQDCTVFFGKTESNLFLQSETYDSIGFHDDSRNLSGIAFFTPKEMSNSLQSSSLSIRTLNKSDRDTDRSITGESFHIPETQYAYRKSDSLFENISIADSACGIDNESARPEEGDASIPETQDIHSQSQQSNIIQLAKITEEDNGMTVGQSQFRICTQEFNGFNESSYLESKDLMECSQLIPHVMHQPVLLRTSTAPKISDKAIQNVDVSSYISTRFDKLAKIPEHALVRITNGQNDDSSDGTCTPDLCDLPEVGQQNVNAIIKSNILQEYVSTNGSPIVTAETNSANDLDIQRSQKFIVNVSTPVSLAITTKAEKNSNTNDHSFFEENDLQAKFMQELTDQVCLTISQTDKKNVILNEMDPSKVKEVSTHMASHSPLESFEDVFDSLPSTPKIIKEVFDEFIKSSEITNTQSKSISSKLRLNLAVGDIVKYPESKVSYDFHDLLSTINKTDGIFIQNSEDGSDSETSQDEALKKKNAEFMQSDRPTSQEKKLDTSMLRSNLEVAENADINAESKAAYHVEELLHTIDKNISQTENLYRVVALQPTGSTFGETNYNAHEVYGQIKSLDASVSKAEKKDGEERDTIKNVITTPPLLSDAIKVVLPVISKSITTGPSLLKVQIEPNVKESNLNETYTTRQTLVHSSDQKLKLQDCSTRAPTELQSVTDIPSNEFLSNSPLKTTTASSALQSQPNFHKNKSAEKLLKVNVDALSVARKTRSHNKCSNDVDDQPLFPKQSISPDVAAHSAPQKRKFHSKKKGDPGDTVVSTVFRNQNKSSDVIALSVPRKCTTRLMSKKDTAEKVDLEENDILNALQSRKNRINRKQNSEKIDHCEEIGTASACSKRKICSNQTNGTVDKSAPEASTHPARQEQISCSESVDALSVLQKRQTLVDSKKGSLQQTSLEDGTTVDLMPIRKTRSDSNSQSTSKLCLVSLPTRRTTRFRNIIEKSPINDCDVFVAQSVQSERKISRNKSPATKGKRKGQVETTIEQKRSRKEPSVSKEESSDEDVLTSSPSISTNMLKICLTMVDHSVCDALKLQAEGKWTIVQNPIETDILVMDTSNRTYKFLVAMAKGIPIVTTKYFESFSKTRLLPKSEHFFKDAKFERQYKFSLRKSCEMAGMKKLFAGYDFLLTSNIMPPPKEMEDIIICSGGTVHKNTPAEQTNQNVYLVSTSKDKIQWHTYRRANKNIVIVDTEAIMLCVMRQVIDPLKDHRIL